MIGVLNWIYGNIKIRGKGGEGPVDVSDIDGKSWLHVTPDRVGNDFDVVSGLLPVYSEEQFLITRQQRSNALDIPLNCLTEQQDYALDVVAELSGSTTDILQVVRASAADVGSITLVLSADIVSEVVDACDSLTNWTTSDVTNTPISIDTSDKFEGTGSLKIQVTPGLSKNDVVTMTLPTAQNWSEKEYIDFYIKATHLAQDMKIQILIEDIIGNSMYQDIFVSQIDTWEQKIFPFDNFIDEMLPLDMTQIKKVKFKILKEISGGIFRIDRIHVPEGPLDTFDLEIYDFGTSGVPTSLSQGTLVRTETIKVKTEFLRGYNISLIPKVPISQDNYFGINITNKAAEIVTLKVHGSLNNNLYTSGAAYTSTDNDNLTAINSGNADIFFLVLSPHDVYLKELQIVADTVNTGNSTVAILIRDSDEILRFLTHEKRMDGKSSDILTWEDLPFIPINNTLRVSYIQDGGQESSVGIKYKYYHDKVISHG